MIRVATLSLALALAGCMSAPNPPPVTLDQLGLASEAPPPTPKIVVQQVCITVKPWDANALKLALAPIPASSPIMTMAIDWNRMRRDAMTCVAAQALSTPTMSDLH
jgi:hypothetical protein